jgi:hypothetical protein
MLTSQHAWLNSFTRSLQSYSNILPIPGRYTISINIKASCLAGKSKRNQSPKLLRALLSPLNPVTGTMVLIRLSVQCALLLGSIYQRQGAHSHPHCPAPASNLILPQAYCQLDTMMLLILLFSPSETCCLFLFHGSNERCFLVLIIRSHRTISKRMDGTVFFNLSHVEAQ